MNYKIQVNDNHYSFDEGYVDLPRWVSYYHQITLVQKIMKIKKKKKLKILEIGVGNNIVTSILKLLNHEVKTLDFDKNLNPDYVDTLPGLIKIKKTKFDVVICCQVLEHIKYVDAIDAIYNILKLSEYLIVSVPNRVLHVSLSLKLSKIRVIKILLQSSFPALKFDFDGQHYWELGAKGYSFRKFRLDISKSGQIIEEFTPVENTYHHFFLIRNYFYEK